MTEKKKYREGDDEVGDESLNDHMPITGFLVVLKPDGKTDVILNLPGFVCDRKADLIDVRDMCNAASADAALRQSSISSAREFTKAMSQAAAHFSSEKKEGK